VPGLRRSGECQGTPPLSRDSGCFLHWDGQHLVSYYASGACLRGEIWVHTSCDLPNPQEPPAIRIERANVRKHAARLYRHSAAGFPLSLRWHRSRPCGRKMGRTYAGLPGNLLATTAAQPRNLGVVEGNQPGIRFRHQELDFDHSSLPQSIWHTRLSRRQGEVSLPSEPDNASLNTTILSASRVNTMNEADQVCRTRRTCPKIAACASTVYELNIPRRTNLRTFERHRVPEKQYSPH